MKTLIAVGALALTIAAPAFAQSQLESSLGVQAGSYTAHELAILHAKAGESGNEAKVYVSNEVATRGIQAAAANDFAAQHAAEGDEGGERNRQFGVSSDTDGSVFQFAFDQYESLD